MKETHSKVWREMLNAEMTSEYFSTLAGRYATRDLWTKIFLAITSSSAVAGWSFWDEVDHPNISIIWRVASGIAAVTSVVLPFLNYSKKVEYATKLKSSYEASAMDYGIIWLSRNDKTDKTLLRELKKTMSKEKSLSSIEAHFPKKKEKLLRICQEKIINRRDLK